MKDTGNLGIKPYILIYTAIILLSGCTGASGTAANESSGIIVDANEAFDSINNEESSANQNSQEAGSTPQGIPETALPDTADSAPMDPGWQFSWQEITIAFPADWEHRCIIKEDTNGFSVFQKASYDEESGLGFICSFLRTTDYINYGMGETLLAYTDSGQLYYLFQATDFSCDAENAEIAGEYSRMCSQAEDLIPDLQIAADGVHYDAGEYILPVSNLLSLSQGNLANLSDNELWIARNEIFARHGRIFTNTYLQWHFNACTWYQGTITPEQFDESILTPTERDNLQLLIAAEQEYDRQHPYPKQYKVTETAVENLSGGGNSNRISYQVTKGECELIIDGKSYDLYAFLENGCLLADPHPKTFYITDIVENDDFLEIAIPDRGLSFDFVTHFFRYDGTLTYIGTVGGWPFAELNNGINGFDGSGRITGEIRTDLIETTYPEGYWQYDFIQNQIVLQETEWHSYPLQPHMLYEDLPLHSNPDPSSKTIFVPADTEIFFLSTDMKEWIQVKGKNGDTGYMQVADYKIVDLDKPADEVISDLDFYD